ncbi:SWR1-complex protein 4 [Abortiporus biennis]
MGPLAADVRSVFDLPGPSNANAGAAPPTQNPARKTQPKKPEGMKRELYSLIGPNANPTLPVQLTKPRLKQKPNLGSGRRVKWEWRPFKNAGRTDGLQLSHWVKAGGDPNAEYLYAKYNIQNTVQQYSQDEYTRLLDDKNWTKEETDYLFQIVQEYDGRFYVIADRYEYPDGPGRSLEEIKDRYFSICRKLVRNRPWAGDEASKASLISSLSYDKERDIARKKYLASLETRTPEQIAEEEALYIELKRLEQNERRFKKDRDDLLRTLLGIESGLPDIPTEDELPGQTPTSTSSLFIDTKKTKKRGGIGAGDLETPVLASALSSHVAALSQAVPKKAQSAKSAAYDAHHFITRSDPPPTNKNTHVPTYVRSYKLPAAKSASAAKIAQIMGELGISHTRLVMPTKENTAHLEGLLEAANSLIEMKKAVDKVEADIRTAQARLNMRASEAEGGGAEGGEGVMELDEEADGAEEAGEDGRAQSVASVRSARSVGARQRKNRRSMSISSVDTSATGVGSHKKKKRRAD